MIKSFGMNIYAGQAEDVLYQHPEVRYACVTRGLDESQIQRVKTFVVLQDGFQPSPEKELIHTVHRAGAATGKKAAQNCNSHY
jgi:acyl-coenzyme A synthetase/AMP-(fatty) acid ligase